MRLTLFFDGRGLCIGSDIHPVTPGLRVHRSTLMRVPLDRTYYCMNEVDVMSISMDYEDKIHKQVGELSVLTKVPEDKIYDSLGWNSLVYQ